jgi:septum formation protein
MEPILLASASPARAALLRGAGVSFDIEPARIDEDGVTAAMLAEGADGTAIAAHLAELKARRISARHPARLVLGADQTLECGGRLVNKPADMAAARDSLIALRGRSHELVAAVVAMRDGDVLWRHEARARLVMRAFSDDFLDDYLARAGEDVLSSVGTYRLEGMGAQLFSRIEGDFFTILGLPLLPLLDFLRQQGVLRS